MRKILRLLCTLFVVLYSINGFAQLSVDTTLAKKDNEIDPIATDRPDQTETPVLTSVGHFQLETGAWFETDKSQADYVQQNMTYNTTLFKYGVSQNLELRLISEYIGEYGHDIHHTDSLVGRNVGLNSFAFGAKIFICEQRGIIPKTSLIAHLQLPYFGTKSFRPNHLAPRFRFTMMNVISDRFSLSYNIGAEWDGVTSSATGIYTVSLAIALVNRLGMFVEAYGFMTERSDLNDVFNGTFANDHRFDGGFTYLINNNLQADVSAGIGLSQNSPDSFVSCGLSWRFKVAKERQ